MLEGYNLCRQLMAVADQQCPILSATIATLISPASEQFSMCTNRKAMYGLALPGIHGRPATQSFMLDANALAMANAGGFACHGLLAPVAPASQI